MHEKSPAKNPGSGLLKATPLGLEPRISEPKSLVLPITPRGNRDSLVPKVTLRREKFKRRRSTWQPEFSSRASSKIKKKVSCRLDICKSRGTRCRLCALHCLKSKSQFGRSGNFGSNNLTRNACVSQSENNFKIACLEWVLSGGSDARSYGCSGFDKFRISID